MAAAGWDRVGVAATIASGAVSVRVRAPLSLPEGVVLIFGEGVLTMPRVSTTTGDLWVLESLPLTITRIIFVSTRL